MYVCMYYMCVCVFYECMCVRMNVCPCVCVYLLSSRNNKDADNTEYIFTSRFNLLEKTRILLAK